MLPQTSIEIELDDEIAKLIAKLDSHTSHSDEYGVILDRIVKLQKLKTETDEVILDRIVKIHQMKSEDRLKLPSLDTALLVAANIFGILWITRYEREHPLTSKALGFVIKPR